MEEDGNVGDILQEIRNDFAQMQAAQIQNAPPHGDEGEGDALEQDGSDRLGMEVLPRLPPSILYVYGCVYRVGSRTPHHLGTTERETHLSRMARTG